MAKEYDKEILTELDGHIDAILDLLIDSDMENDSANRFRDELYAYLNPRQVTLQLIMKNLSTEPTPEPAKPALPTTLDEAVNYVLPRFEGMERYATEGEDRFAARCHSQLSGGIGMKIRNEFQLWIPESPLHQHFLTVHNLFHPDEMSDLIIRHVYRKLIQK